jgi:branched-chain amino acid transport system permease protein
LNRLPAGGRRAAAWLALAAAVLAPAYLGDYPLSVLDNIMTSAIIAIGLVMLTGIIGMVSLGQAAFAGLGGYVSAYAALNWGINPWLTLPVALLAAAAPAAVIGALTLRMSAQFLVLATLAWGISFFYLAGALPMFGGQNGLSGIPPLVIAGLPLGTDRGMYPVTLAGLALVVWMSLNLLNSNFGRMIRTIRYGAAIGESAGANIFLLRLTVFTIAATFAGFAGWLYTFTLQFLDPNAFSLDNGIQYLFMAVIGGVSNIWGGLIGAAAYSLADRFLSGYLQQFFGQSLNVSSIFFGVVMLVVMQTARGGLWPFVSGFLPPAREEFVPLAPLERPAPPPPGAVLRVTNAVKKFQGLVAVNDLSFEVDAGEILALIGPNGAGKSTIFNLITGLLQSTSGSINFLGQDITARRSREIARLGLGRTFQHVRLVPTMTVLENVAVGGYVRHRTPLWKTLLRLNRAGERRALAEAAYQLERVGLLARQAELAANLSLGEQRILEIARALNGNPLLLLLDEPAAGLRYNEKQQLAELLIALRDEGMTILLVEHDMAFIRQVAGRVVVVQYGEKLAQGSITEIQRNQAVREAYLGVD